MGFDDDQSILAGFRFYSFGWLWINLAYIDNPVCLIFLKWDHHLLIRWFSLILFDGDQSILAGYTFVFICAALSQICPQLFSDCQRNKNVCNNLAVFCDCHRSSNKPRLVTHAPHCPRVVGGPWSTLESQVIVLISFYTAANMKCNIFSLSSTGSISNKKGRNIKCNNKMNIFSTSSLLWATETGLEMSFQIYVYPIYFIVFPNSTRQLPSFLFLPLLKSGWSEESVCDSCSQHWLHREGWME